MLHVFAHSSGENLSEVQDVGGKNPAAFARWLADGGRVFDTNDYDMKKKRTYQIYIHACVSSDYARQVKAALKLLNPDMNDAVRVYGTQGISATSVDGRPVVIPMDLTTEWLQFEKKLGNNKGRDEEISAWKKKYMVFPDGYDEF